MILLCRDNHGQEVLTNIASIRPMEVRSRSQRERNTVIATDTSGVETELDLNIHTVELLPEG